MRKVLFIVLIFVLVPLILAGMEYNVTIQKKGYLYHIVGTDYYLKISGCYEFGYKMPFLILILVLFLLKLIIYMVQKSSIMSILIQLLKR